MQIFRRIYCRIPGYGQLVVRRSSVRKGWFKSNDVETYYSLMVKGTKKSWFTSNTFYLVFTESCLAEAIKRGEANAKFQKTVSPFGLYTGIEHIDRGGNLKNSKCDCIFLNVYKYVDGGHVAEFTIALSERQFRRAIVRAKTRPELRAKKKIWHGFYRKLYEAIVAYAES